MYLAATDHDSVTLVQPDTFTSFHVQRTAGVDLDSAFASSGAGQVAGEHVLVSIEWLRAQSSDPFIVFEDADLDKAVDGAIAAKMRNMGEACTAANRFLVQESVAAEFTRKFAAVMGALTTGRGTEAATQVGPLIDAGARDDVHALVSAAVGAGATAVTGGAPVDGPGYFYQPTVLSGVPNDAEILRQEIFGPVAPVTTFTSEEDAIRLANASEYGLASYVYSRDFNRLLRVAEQIEFGMVGFNAGVISNAAAPFGGVKQSGLGREGGTEGIAEYTTTQYIGIADPYTN